MILWCVVCLALTALAHFTLVPVGVACFCVLCHRCHHYYKDKLKKGKERAKPS